MIANTSRHLTNLIAFLLSESRLEPPRHSGHPQRRLFQNCICLKDRRR